MARDGIISGVIAEEFGTKVRAVREAKRMSREDLSRLSGVAVVTLGRLEGPNPPKPRRKTVIDLARAFSWDVDENLGALDYPPLTGDERAELARSSGHREQLDRMLDELPDSVLSGLLALVRAILNPQTLPPGGGDNDTRNPGVPGVNIQYAQPGSGDILGARRGVRRRAED